MHHRIKGNEQHYEYICDLAKENDHFKPFKRWYEGREDRPSDHVLLVKKRFLALRGRKKGDGYYRHKDIAEVAGCSKTTVTHVINDKCEITKQRAKDILKALDKQNL